MRRLCAAGIDFIISSVLSVIVYCMFIFKWIMLIIIQETDIGNYFILRIVLLFFISYILTNIFYYVFFNRLFQGYSLGKRIMRYHVNTGADGSKERVENVHIEAVKENVMCKKRLIAVIIDYFVMLLIYTTFILFCLFYFWYEYKIFDYILSTSLLYFWAYIFIYFFIMDYFYHGGSIGKKKAGIRLLADKSRFKIRSTLIHAILKTLACCIWPVSLIFYLSKGVMFYDKWMKLEVVNDEPIIKKINLKYQKYKKKFKTFLFSLFLIALCVICCTYIFREQIQRRIKETVFTKVIKYEENLNEIVAECNDNINLAYDKFHLYNLFKYKNDESVAFYVKPSLISYVLWDDYRYGFYFSQNDNALNVIDGSGECETEFEKKNWLFLSEYWYKTERITENWWFFESKTITKAPSMR